MFEEGVAAPPRRPWGAGRGCFAAESLETRAAFVPRTFPARPPICATSHRREGSRARVRGRAGRSVEERNRRRCFDREANRRSQPAFRAPGGRGGWFRRRVSAIVILKSSPLPLSPSLAFSTPLNFLLVVDHQRGFLVWSSVSSLILKNVSLLRFLHD